MADDDSKLPPSGRFQRFRKLAGLSAQLGGDVIARGVKRLTGSDESLMSKGTAEKLVATLGDLKGAAMKFGQAVSMEPDLLTPEVRTVLSRLQNEAPPMAYAQVAEVVEEELGAPPEALFASFDESPTAAASLGQVHRARLEDGREVAVKVQYPGIATALNSDLDTLGALVKTVARASRGLDGTAYYKELRTELLLETDYEREALLAREFADAVRPLGDLRVPEVVPTRSSRRVLTLEYLEGPTLKSFLTSEPDAQERARVSRLLLRAIYGPFLRTGQIHADPHPGNFLVMPDGRLGLLDFGSVKRLPMTFVQSVRGALERTLQGNEVNGLDFLREVGFTLELPDAEAAGFVREVVEIGGRPLRVAEYDHGTCAVTRDMRKLFAANLQVAMKIRPPSETVMFWRSVGGCTQNLKLLGARFGVADVMRELLAVR
jgi:predicted unusual protein kinase regulating ubiquinone biosynthesis (AarF/ABC1/UbiB family)